jgi:hypothetical protein
MRPAAADCAVGSPNARLRGAVKLPQRSVPHPRPVIKLLTLRFGELAPKSLETSSRGACAPLAACPPPAEHADIIGGCSLLGPPSLARQRQRALTSHTHAHVPTAWSAPCTNCPGSESNYKRARASFVWLPCCRLTSCGSGGVGLTTLHSAPVHRLLIFKGAPQQPVPDSDGRPPGGVVSVHLFACHQPQAGCMNA